MIGITIAVGIVAVFGLTGIRIVRPTHKMLIETLGKYSKTAEQGFHWIIPLIQSGRYVNITERMVDVPPQTVQTSDKLNMTVDAVVYFRVGDVKSSQYNVSGFARQLTSLARTTLRAVMGKMDLTQCIQDRNKINEAVAKILDKETDAYGVKVLRVEVQRIEPPVDVQEAMNEVVKAAQKKTAAKDFASAQETKADGQRMADIKLAEGQKRSSILNAEGIKESSIRIAEGKAKAFKLIEDSFKGNAQTLKKLEVTENSLKNNAKIILTEKGITPQLLIGELPLKAKN